MGHGYLFQGTAPYFSLAGYQMQPTRIPYFEQFHYGTSIVVVITIIIIIIIII
jgi:hypothetical protein